MSKRASSAAGAQRNAAAASVASGSEELHPDRWTHARQRDVDWAKIDLLCVVYWLRQALAVVLGIVWGLIPLTGLPAMLLYGTVSSVVLWVYYTQFLRVDDEDELYGGRFALMSEGAFPAFATFLLSWILVYSLPY
jgi:hypothetical protein